MKCIGGELDGKIFTHISEDTKRGDVVQLRTHDKFEKASFEADLEAFRNNRSPDYLTATIILYRVCSISFMDTRNGVTHTIKYLIPHGWHEWEGIQHLFRNYRAP